MRGFTVVACCLILGCGSSESPATYEQVVEVLSRRLLKTGPGKFKAESGTLSVSVSDMDECTLTISAKEKSELVEVASRIVADDAAVIQSVIAGKYDNNVSRNGWKVGLIDNGESWRDLRYQLIFSRIGY